MPKGKGLLVGNAEKDGEGGAVKRKGQKNKEGGKAGEGEILTVLQGIVRENYRKPLLYSSSDRMGGCGGGLKSAAVYKDFLSIKGTTTRRVFQGCLERPEPRGNK